MNHPEKTRTARSLTVSLILFILLALLYGCSLDYSQGAFDEAMVASIPDTVLYSFTHTVIRDGKPVFVITAEKAESFRKRNQTVMSGIEFREYDVDGTVLTEGKADSTIFYDDTEDADISGNIQVHSTREKGGLTGDTLYWKSREKLLTADSGQEVELERDSGSLIRGRGFSADFRRRTLNFESSVTGTYQTEEE